MEICQVPWLLFFIHRNARPDCHGEERESHGRLPLFPSATQIAGRGDSYFGIMALENNDCSTYLWHCSRPSEAELRRHQGNHVQLVGLSELHVNGTAIMVYPSSLALQRDQGAHNMCLVDLETKNQLDIALKFKSDSKLAYGIGSQYDDLGR